MRLTGAAEARAIEAVGRAEAEKMRMKASAYKQYGDAAVMALVVEALPQVRIISAYWWLSLRTVPKKAKVANIIISLFRSLQIEVFQSLLSDLF